MLLDGRELAGYIKERHSRQVAAMPTKPNLAIVQSSDDPATASYIRVKSRYGRDIGATVKVYEVTMDRIRSQVEQLNEDPEVDGIIVQLPLPERSKTNEVTETVAPHKDVDGLHPHSQFTPATPMAILWLLAGYGVAVEGQRVTLVGKGRLVGAPLSKLLRQSGAKVTVCDSRTEDLPAATRAADIVVSATGRPGLIKPGMVKPGAVVVDAGSGESGGSIKGDVDPELQKDTTLKITPNPGGVGPMTVVALFENLLQAAQRPPAPGR
ncbi:bifunctional 5,10-methylenetetrahydrofolate dehydrogenase/5,10-methenyltetrahydrofolate cyclohydrolase [Candidatus Parcubacteria bacterium]|nr:bifunctional 5,10-methylenetetrahydrofolate dehydrogenase/5,10-methenyltetrahydrofolate cyclohydrolase [Candidatus Parcubacteria bacterium]